MRAGYIAEGVRAKVIRLAREGLPTSAIAERAGCTIAYVRKVIRGARNRELSGDPATVAAGR